MKENQKTLLIAVVALVLFGIWTLLGGNDVEHIEDINGPDDYSLAVITEEEILGKGIKSAKGGPKTKTSRLTIGGMTISSGTTFFSEQYTGIKLLDEYTLFRGSDLEVQLYNFEITAGNLEILVVLDGKIVGKMEPGMDSHFLLRDTDGGLYQLYLVGESAAFEFTSTDLTE